MPGPVFMEGEMVSLRPIEEADLPFLQRAVNDPRVWRGIGRNQPINATQEEEFFEEVISDEESVHLLVTVDGERSSHDRDTEVVPVGTVGLSQFNHELGRAELGYWIAPDHHQQGYGSDAVSRLVEYGFDQRALHRIEARVFEFNEGSQRLLEGLGFTHEGTLRDRQFVDGERQDVLWYGVLEDDWSG